MAILLLRNLHITASTVNSELYNATLLIATSENEVGRLQLASIAGCKTMSDEVFRVMFALCLPPILHFNTCILI